MKEARALALKEERATLKEKRLKLRQGFWGRARELRPSIYEKPGKLSSILAQHNSQNLNYGQYVRFYKKFSRENRAEGEPDVFGLHAAVAKLRGNSADYFTVERRDDSGNCVSPVSLRILFIVTEIAKNALKKSLGMGEAEAAEDAAEAAGKMTRIIRAFEHSAEEAEGTWAYANDAAVCAFEALHEKRGEVWMREGVIPRLTRGVFEEVAGMIKARDWFRRGAQEEGYFSAGTPSGAALKGFGQDNITFIWKQTLGKENGHELFRYPTAGCRLAAVLGDMRRTDAASGEVLREITRATAADPFIRLFSAILTYPWEASHILKAREMRRRGIEACRPVGTIFTKGVEYGIFEWARGETLVNSWDLRAWEEFGKMIRSCHERGIILNDAAGRNAIWDGNRIALIDFEHTYLNELAAPISEEERERSLERVRDEVGGSELGAAFEKGYSCRA